MPRNLHRTVPFRATRIPAILRTQVRKPREQITPATPRLWNAKRRIKHSRGLTPRELLHYRRNPTTYDWRSRVSPDVVSFYDANPSLLPAEKTSLLRSPSKYFSRPHRVPIDQRKQIYLPNFTIIFIRTPRLGPYYAHFQVPLWFNKLDMKSYLKNVYNVDTAHIRSYVTHGRKDRRTAHRAGAQGKAYRIKSRKRMTVQLVEPFEWPEEVKDFTEYIPPLPSPVLLSRVLTILQMGPKEYWRSMKAQVDIQRRESKQWKNSNPDQEHRVSIAKHAQEMLKGKATWKPTWTQIPSDRRIMDGVVRSAPTNSKDMRIPPPPVSGTASPLIPPR